ncbi:MAG: hypothetical protein RIA69_09865 [Cyclobacteriaceae bacterium]
MSKKIIIFNLAWLWILSCSFGQNNIQENVYLHVNDELLLTGETLYFSAYCNSEATGKPSELSQILYVELIDHNQNAVFQQKIGLENGRGYGDFFLSSLIPTGSYQLLAYTRWMKNFGQYFSTKIQVVNPFEKYEAPAVVSKIEIEFLPEGGALIEGTSNLMAMRSNVQKTLTGRVVNEAGEKQADIYLNSTGYGSFEFTTEISEQYQAIIEDDQGGFYFFELPTVRQNASIIQLSRNQSAFTLSVLGKISPTMRLVAYDAQNIILDRPATSGETYSIRTENLKNGIYKAALVDGEEEISSRLLLHKSANFSILKETSAGTYSKRSKVSITLPAEQDASVSVSVRKINPMTTSYHSQQHELLKHLNYPLSQQDMDDQILFANWKYGESIPDFEEVSLLPELRGQLISGSISPPQEGTSLIYSNIGNDYQMASGLSMEDGRFTIQIEPFYGNQLAYISAINIDTTIILKIDNPFLDSYPDFDYSLPVLDSGQIANLTKRSIRNQIENAYFNVKMHELLPTDQWLPQFPKYDFLYVLDDYNRFPKMYEHFIEYIPAVSARKGKTRSKLKVLLANTIEGEYDPLLLLDGVPVTAEKILSFSPYKIERIGVINNRIYLGNLVADGMIAFETFEHNLMNFPISNNQIEVDYQGLKNRKDYTFPEYETDSALNKIPDYRDQLYWSPELKLFSGKNNEITFYTSDTPGDFEVIVEGYTYEGKPLSIRRYFTVK